MDPENFKLVLQIRSFFWLHGSMVCIVASESVQLAHIVETLQRNLLQG